MPSRVERRKPPLREPVTRGLPLEHDLTDVPDSALTAELIRRGFRPMVQPAKPKKGTKR